MIREKKKKSKVRRNRWDYWVLRMIVKTVNTGSCLSSFQNETQYKGGEKLVKDISCTHKDQYKTSLPRTVKKQNKVTRYVNSYCFLLKTVQHVRHDF